MTQETTSDIMELRTTKRKEASLMSHYTHLTIDEREKAMLFLSQGLSFRKIAKLLGRSPSTISREIKRNAKWNGEYSADYAKKKYAKRREVCHKHYVFENAEAVDYVIERLKLHWTPEEIAGRAKLDNEDLSFSYASIYRAIKSNLLPKSLKSYLRRGNKYRNHKPNGRKSKFEGCRSISERSEEINQRLTFGHWEGDSVLGTRKSKARLAVLVERKSGFYVALKLKDGTSETYIDTVSKYFKDNFNQAAFKSFTVDRGSEFSLFNKFEELIGSPIYVCDPYAPWQRGSNENTNGLLRFFFPKKTTSFDDVSDEQIAYVVSLINNRPRKRLNWASPQEVFSNFLLHLD